MTSKTTELENRIQEAHSRYVTSKTKVGGSTRKSKRSNSGRFEDAIDANVYSGNMSVRSGRNLSQSSRERNNKGGGDGNRSHSSSYAFLHLTKDLESIY